MELTCILISRNQNRYPFAACTANGLPAFDGMLFDVEGHAITTRDTVRIARSRGHAKRNRYHEIKDTLQAAIALLPQGYVPESAAIHLTYGDIQSHMVAKFMKEHDKPLAISGAHVYMPVIDELCAKDFGTNLSLVVDTLIPAEGLLTGHQRITTKHAARALAGYMSGYEYVKLIEVEE